MKPIPSPISREAFDLMNKARDMITRIDSLVKDGDTFTIGDIETGKHGTYYPKGGQTLNDELGESSTKEGSLGWEEYQRLRERGDFEHMRELEDKVGDVEAQIGGAWATDEEAKRPPRSEVRVRGEKRGEAGRGRNTFKRPDDESSKRMTPEQRGIDVNKSGDEGSQPTFATSFNTNPQDMAFVSESGGTTRSAYYSTNQHLLDSEDVANKGSTSVSISLEKLASMLNPHEGGGVSRLEDNGVLKSVCEICGGNQYSGCRGNCPKKRLN